MKKSTSNSPPKPTSKDENKIEKTNLPKSKSDFESINSTIVKMQDFLSEHDVASNLSISDSVQPLESSSFPLDYKKIEQEQKTKKADKVSEIKKALESKRSDFEDIRMHLEKRAEEMRKRIKILKIDKNDEKKDKSSVNLSYHSTEFNPDYGSNVMPFKNIQQSLSNKERLRLFTDKQLQQKESNEQDSKQKDETIHDHSPMTHAIFVHLAKLKNIKTAFFEAQKSKEDQSVKSKEDRKLKSKEDQSVKSKDVKRKVKELDSGNKANSKKSKDDIKDNVQSSFVDDFLSREDSDSTTHLNRNASLRSDSCSSIKSRFSDEDTD